MAEVLQRSLETLFRELVLGPGGGAAWMLNRTDAGLLRSLDKLTAAGASATPASGGASIAAHVDHVRYGLSLLNRWSAGERDPWSAADWTTSWSHSVVTEQEWAALRHALERETLAWLDALGVRRDYSLPELNDVIGSIAHLAYHFGAIRQIDRSVVGP